MIVLHRFGENATWHHSFITSRASRIAAMVVIGRLSHLCGHLEVDPFGSEDPIVTVVLETSHHVSTLRRRGFRRSPDNSIGALDRDVLVLHLAYSFPLV